MRAGAEVDVAGAQAGQLRDPQAGLHGNIQQGAVPAPGPGAAVRGGQQGLDFCLVEVADLPPLAAPGGDVQHPGDERGVLGVAERRVAEERPDRGQPGVAGAGAVFPFLLKMAEEACDERGVEVADVELAGLLAGSVMSETQQEPPGVPVGGDRMRTGVTLADEPLGEVGLEGGGERAHACLPAARSRRWAASDSNSGTADRYQYVFDGLAWPM